MKVQSTGSAPSSFLAFGDAKRGSGRGNADVKYMSLGYLQGPGITLSKQAQMELQFCVARERLAVPVRGVAS